MKISIIVEDGTVCVDGLCRTELNISNCEIPSNVWALQWKETTGWIEFTDNPDGTKPPNETITLLPQWANYCVQVWEAWTPPAPPPPTNPIPATVI